MEQTGDWKVSEWKIVRIQFLPILEEIGKCQNHQTLIVSAYMDINYSIRNEALTNILEYRLGLILAIDSNAHSTLWGHSNNPGGTIMTEIITEYGFLLRYIGKEYTYDCQLGKSVIDLTLTCNPGVGILD